MDLGIGDEDNAQNLAIRFASIKRKPDESFLSYRLRFSSLASRLESAVERETPGRSLIDVMCTTYFRLGLLPEIRDRQWSGESVPSLKEAIDRARRIEACLQQPDVADYIASLRAAGVPNHRRSSNDDAAVTRGTLSSSSSDEHFSSSASNKRGSRKRKRRQRQRPVCTWPKCNKPVGHIIARCGQRIRSQRKAQRERRAQRQKKRAKTSRATARRLAAQDGYDGSSDE